jgi:hypothetical protein
MGRWLAVAALTGTVALAAVAKGAFRGHGDTAEAATPASLGVPAPDAVPEIAGDPAPLQPPPAPPQQAPAEGTSPPPPVSGGS